MVAVADVAKRYAHIAQHGVRIRMLRRHAAGHSKAVDERRKATRVTTADAVENLQTGCLLKVGAVGVRRNVGVCVPEK